MKSITILGSTGSIGRCALDVISMHPDRFRVCGLAAGGNINVLLKQVAKFKPEIVGVFDKAAAGELRKHTSIPVYEGQEGVCRAAGYEGADFVLSAIVGFAGLLPTLSAIRAGKTIGLANKESLVVAGELVIREAARHNVKILPVDSEHSAAFQCIEGRKKDIKRLILTASGGPFSEMTRAELGGVGPEDALKHPNWSMGRKITVDSATLMNKGFEVIEAHYLFGIEPEKIDVLIHPQSIIHCIVELTDGGLLAHMSVPDMKAPIAYALSYPERLNDVVSRLDLARIQSLTFKSPDNESFPCLSYAYQALKQGGTMPAVLNAANEIAVEAFLKRQIGFNDIPAIIKNTMDAHEKKDIMELDSVIEADRRARETAGSLIRTLSRG